MKVLAAIDGSGYSTFVMNELCVRKWSEGSIIKLVTVMDTSPLQHSESVQCAQQYLEDASKYLSQIHPNVQFVSEILYGHDAGRQLLEFANEWGAELAIVAAHGKGRLQRALLGSVSECLLDHGMLPVIVAKEAPQNTHNDSINILLAIDNSEFSVEAMEWFMRQSWTKPVNIKLMTVLSAIPEHYSSEQDTNKAMDMLTHQQNIKDEVMAVFQRWGAHFQKNIAPAAIEYQIREGIAADEIILEAQAWSANLIVMGSHGRTGLKRYMIGSVARAVCYRSPCSVEIVRAPDFAEYYRNWKIIDRKTQLKDLRKSGRLDTPHVVGAFW